MRQLALADLRGPLEPVVAIHGILRTRLHERGVSFAEDTEGDWPGPTDVAAIELTDGSQYLLSHPAFQPADEYLYVRAQVRIEGPPQEAAQPFLRWLEVSSEDIQFFYEAWPPPYYGPAT